MKTKSVFRLYAFIRWVFYLLIISTAFISSTIGTSVKPILLIPIAICISINEGDEMTATITGILSGLLMDISFDKTFGYNAIILIGCCVFTSLLFNHLLRPNVINAFLVCAVLAFIHGILDYLFYYAIWGYENVSKIFFSYTIISWIYTSISTIFIYLLINLIHSKFQPRRIHSIEEPIDNED
ncbi:MAG: rod shape-determining protein MreD [Clostridiales bacterium]|nr:rod shape-determining protein MreD [Clostridiales bacterium]